MFGRIDCIHSLTIIDWVYLIPFWPPQFPDSQERQLAKSLIIKNITKPLTWKSSRQRETRTKRDRDKERNKESQRDIQSKRGKDKDIYKEAQTKIDKDRQRDIDKRQREKETKGQSLI